MMKAEASRSVTTGWIAATKRLCMVLAMNAPLITSSSKLHARNAPDDELVEAWLMVVLYPGEERACCEGMVHSEYEAIVSPKIRLTETIESWSNALMSK